MNELSTSTSWRPTSLSDNFSAPLAFTLNATKARRELEALDSPFFHSLGSLAKTLCKLNSLYQLAYIENGPFRADPLPNGKAPTFVCDIPSMRWHAALPLGFFLSSREGPSARAMHGGLQSPSPRTLLRCEPWPAHMQQLLGQTPASTPRCTRV